MSGAWLLPLALSYLGTPYKWGGSSRLDGLDCSGLVQDILKSAGNCPPGDNTAQGLFDYFSKNGSYNIYKLGSLVFFGKSAVEVTHVAMLVDENFILEAGGGGHKIITRDDAITANALTRISPLKYRQDMVAVIRPRYLWDF